MTNTLNNSYNNGPKQIHGKLTMLNATDGGEWKFIYHIAAACSNIGDFWKMHQREDYCHFNIQIVIVKKRTRVFLSTN